MNTQESSAASLSLSKYGLDRIQFNLLTSIVRSWVGAKSQV